MPQLKPLDSFRSKCGHARVAYIQEHACNECDVLNGDKCRYCGQVTRTYSGPTRKLLLDALYDTTTQETTTNDR